MSNQTTPAETVKREKIIFKELVGAVNDTEIELNDSGWDSRVYSTKNGQFFIKFPRSEKIQKRYAYEIEALRIAAGLNTAINVPIVKWRDPDNRYFGYEGVVGKQLDAVVDQLNSETKIVIGSALGSFLEKFHWQKLPGTKIMDISKEIEQLQFWHKKSLPIIQNIFDINEQDKIHDLVFRIVPDGLNTLGSSMMLCHGDLAGWNIIYQGDGKVGIIDFGDICYSDPSKDLIDFGDEEISESVIKAYGDSDILRKKIEIRKIIPEIISLGFFAGKNDQHGINKTVISIKQLLP